MKDRARVLAISLILAAVAALVPVATALAHTSYYCGHSNSGTVNITAFAHHHDDTGYAHIHGYNHYYIYPTGPVYQHHQHRGC